MNNLIHTWQFIKLHTEAISLKITTSTRLVLEYHEKKIVVQRATVYNEGYRTLIMQIIQTVLKNFLTSLVRDNKYTHLSPPSTTAAFKPVNLPS